jgi:hypothetical protein
MRYDYCLAKVSVAPINRKNLYEKTDGPREKFPSIPGKKESFDEEENSCDYFPDEYLKHLPRQFRPFSEPFYTRQLHLVWEVHNCE